MLRFAIPSKGTGYDNATQLLERCGLRLARPSPRTYTATLRGLPGVEILLHRPEDIIEKVADGSIDIGITGLDLLSENRADDENILIICDDLGFWGVELIFAAPQSWIDVNSWQDLADLAVEMQQEGRSLRIATKFPNLVRRFCYTHGINVFRLVPSAGATEAAPLRGYADIIADITETGTALRENQLKIVGGTILRSQACLIGSRQSLRGNNNALALIRQLVELIEAQQQGRTHYSLFANVPGQSVEAVGKQITAYPELAGIQGPTISPVWNKHAESNDTSPENWYTVNVVVLQKELMPAIDHLRSIGASSVTVTPVHYTFYAQSAIYKHLLEMLEKET